MAREFSRPIEVLIASQPTRGLDVGSIEYIHNRIIQKRDEGTAVLLVSSELDEILALSDRIAVMYRGQDHGDRRSQQGRQGIPGAADGRHRGIQGRQDVEPRGRKKPTKLSASSRRPT